MTMVVVAWVVWISELSLAASRRRINSPRSSDLAVAQLGGDQKSAPQRCGAFFELSTRLARGSTRLVRATSRSLNSAEIKRVPAAMWGIFLSYPLALLVDQLASFERPRGRSTRRRSKEYPAAMWGISCFSRCRSLQHRPAIIRSRQRTRSPSRSRRGHMPLLAAAAFLACRSQ